MSAFSGHTCALADDGKVWCWGDNGYGELGDGTSESRGNPAWVPLPRRAVDVSAGLSHSCAVLDDGTAYCWGANMDGRVAPTAENVPATVPTLVFAPDFSFTKISSSARHTCALTTSATVVCWGRTTEGQCGIDGTATGIEQTFPFEIPHLDHVRAIDSGLSHTCALRSATPNLVCWGSNSFTLGPGGINGKLGPAANGFPYSALPLAVADDMGIPIVGLGVGSESTYALAASGVVFAWGSNARKQLGNQDDMPWNSTPKAVMKVDDEQAPVALTEVGEVLRSSGAGACVQMAELTQGARYYCWGSDDYGELGFGSVVGQAYQYARPTVLPYSASNMARGDHHACVTVDEGEGTEIRCFGSSALVGNGTTDHPASQPLPTAVKWNPENAQGFLTK